MSGMTGTAMAQSASFNFSLAPHAVSGWTNVSGDPSLSVISVTDPSGISVNSVATASWSQYGDQSAYDGLGENVDGFFPGAVLVNHWYNYDNKYNSAHAQLAVTGLNRGRTYMLKMAGSSTSSLSLNPAVYTIVGATYYSAQGVDNNNNITNGAVFTGVSPDSSGTIHIYINYGLSAQAADISGLVVTTMPSTAGSLIAGAGVAAVGDSLALGDSVTGVGPHAFTANRYQYLNGHQYSFGGSARDVTNRPVFRGYDNGDLVFSSTMDKSVNTGGQTGMRFYSKLGVLELGGTDRLDTTVSIQTGYWGGGGIVVHSDDSAYANTIKGRLYDSYLAGGENRIDSTAELDMIMLNGENNSMSNGRSDDVVITGYGNQFPNKIGDAIVSGNGHDFIGLVGDCNINGYIMVAMDTTYGELASGAVNHFNGLWQMTAGVDLYNRLPSGTVLGSGNVDFPGLVNPVLNWPTTTVPGSYPLFEVGNATSYGAGIRSNAITTLYNGRTQINTTGYVTGLTQTAVTPQAALDVVSNNSGVLFPRLSSAQRTAIASGDLHNGLLLYNTDSSAFQYYNGSAWSLIGIAGAGNRWISGNSFTYDSLNTVGIGTSNTQGYQLAVNGAGVVTKMVVKPAASWPDYVFGPGYRLRGLDELGRYVAERRHLPEVASEAEVKQNGMDVADQQAALLKKVEELTLYMIRLNKRADELEKANARLRKQLAHGNKSNK